ncbi:MAG: hypothetical protein FWG78_00090 [Coriobacteriia bacterium]|nr:hypothetical protein [Coriobacteriia bacterium]
MAEISKGALKGALKRILKGALVFEDGTRFEGVFVGTVGTADVGDGTSLPRATTTPAEVIVETALVGYQEIITDPANAGKIVVMAMPQIGNYGVNEEDIHAKAPSSQPTVAALVVREMCYEPSNFRATGTLPDYLGAAGVPALDGVDTRAVTIYLRENPGQKANIERGVA